MQTLKWRDRVAIASVALLLMATGFAKGQASEASIRREALKELATEIDAGDAGPEVSGLVVDSGGYLRFVGSEKLSTPAAKGATPRVAADTFLARWRPLLAADTPRLDLAHMRTRKGSGGSSVRYQQTCDGLPVVAAQAVVQVGSDGAVRCAFADLMREVPDIAVLSTEPTVMSHEARDRAVLWALRRNKTLRYRTTKPELMVYAPEVVGNRGATRLVWAMDVTNSGDPVFGERVYIDAHENAVAFHYALIHSALNRSVYDAANVSGVDPGTLVRSEGGGAASLAEANYAYDYLGDTYSFYSTEHGRDSIDDAGYGLSATVRYVPAGGTAPYENAFWNGVRMYFGDGLAAADDVVAHELTHGVTDDESNLVYSNQSGAINESFSDMWGEWIDQSNGSGNDGASVKWQLGEDLPASIGVIRDMSDPTLFNDPDRMNSPHYYTGTGDYGGVHTNSGVGNKLCYLLTDGGSFNGYTITGMGISRTADIFYECQTSLLTSGADYADLYVAAVQAAVNQGWTTSERENLRNAFHAVEIRFDGLQNFAATNPEGSGTVNFSWANPGHPGFSHVVIRASTSGYPGNASEGNEVYNGTGTSATGSAALGVTTYYSAWAIYGSDELSQVERVAVVAGEGPLDYFTEDFTSSGNFDLDYHTLTLMPDSTSDYYRAFLTTASDFPTNPSGGSTLNLDDDDYASYNPSQNVSLYGQSYGMFYVGSNGYITFGEGDDTYTASTVNHFGIARLSPVFNDFSPDSGGSVSVRELSDRVAVTWQGIPEFLSTNSSSFQVEMFFDGTIRMTWLRVDATQGVVGISEGNDTPAGFSSSDISSYESRSAMGVYQALEASATGSFFLGVWNYNANQWAGSGTVSGTGKVDYLCLPGDWNGAYLYDMDAAAYQEAYYVYREE